MVEPSCGRCYGDRVTPARWGRYRLRRCPECDPGRWARALRRARSLVGGPWHDTRDGGHSVAVVPLCLEGRHPPIALLTPAPVRTVLRVGYELRNGWPVMPVSDAPDAPVRYDEFVGLVVPSEDEER